MRSNSDAHRQRTGLTAALAVPLLTFAFIFSTMWHSALAKGQSRPSLLIAQADSDMPDELKGMRRRGKFGLKAEDSNSSYGQRPFRRPSESDSGSTTSEASPGNRPNAGQDNGPGAGLPPGERRRRPFAGMVAPQGGFPRPAEGGPQGAGFRPGLRARGLRGQGMPNGEGQRRAPLVQQYGQQPPAAAGKFQTSGGLFGSRKPLDFSSLALTSEQKDRIREIRKQNSAPVREMQKSLRESRLSMRDLMFDPSASDEQIRSKRREVRQMQDRVEEMQINDFLSIRRVLTPEQRQRLPDLKPIAGAGGPQVAGTADADGGPPQHP